MTESEQELEKVCINCRHWDFDAGTRDYSEYTPGDVWTMTCEKSRFDMLQGYDVTSDQLRETLLTARNCEDFTPRETL